MVSYQSKTTLHPHSYSSIPLGMVNNQSKTTLHPHSYSSIPLGMVSYQSKTTLHPHSYSSIPLGMVSYQSKTTLHSHSYSPIPLGMVYLTYCYVFFAIKENDVELVSDKIFAFVSMKNTLINSFGIDTYNYIQDSNTALFSNTTANMYLISEDI